jgi:hypothetical protein
VDYRDELGDINPSVKHLRTAGKIVPELQEPTVLKTLVVAV